MMFKIFDLVFLENARRLGLGHVSILVTSHGFLLYAFSSKHNLVLSGKYKTLAGAKAEFFRICLQDDSINFNDLLWFRVTDHICKMIIAGDCA